MYRAKRNILSSDEQTLHLLGHAMFLIPIQLFIYYIIYGVYIIYKERSNTQYPSKPPKIYIAPRQKRTPHNVVVLEQNVDEALYGKRDDKKREFP